MPSRRHLLLPPVFALLALAGCRDEKITTYRVPKETPATAPAMSGGADPHAGLNMPATGAAMPADMATTAVPTAAGGDLTWTAPGRWQSRPATAMRKATYIIPGSTAGEQAELSVTAFPGDVGGNLANLNRWRGQLHLPPITENELDSALSHTHVGELHIEVAELLGPEPADGKPRQRVLGAIVPVNGSTWFFKLTGPDALVAGEKEAFLAFLQTLQPAS